MTARTFSTGPVTPDHVFTGLAPDLWTLAPLVAEAITSVLGKELFITETHGEMTADRFRAHKPGHDVRITGRLITCADSAILRKLKILIDKLDLPVVLQIEFDEHYQVEGTLLQHWMLESGMYEHVCTGVRPPAAEELDELQAEAARRASMKSDLDRARESLGPDATEADADFLREMGLL